MARPLTLSDYEIRMTIEKQIQAQKRKELAPSHQEVWGELDEIRERIADMEG